AFIGEKWGDEVIGEILQATANSGVEQAFHRALGLSLDELSDEWRDAVQTTYLPQLSEHYRARRMAQPLLTEKRSDGTLHVAPALSPDGRDIVYLSEKNSFFVDLYLADAETGRVRRRLVKSSLSSNYESLRFITSAGTYSPDGRLFAIAVKHRDREQADRALPRRRRSDRSFASHGGGQEHQPAVGSRRALVGLRLRSHRDQQRLSVRFRGRQRLPVDRLVHRGGGHHHALPGAVVGAPGGPPRVRLLRGPALGRLQRGQPALAEAAARARPARAPAADAARGRPARHDDGAARAHHDPRAAAERHSVGVPHAAGAAALGHRAGAHRLRRASG